MGSKLPPERSLVPRLLKILFLRLVEQNIFQKLMLKSKEKSASWTAVAAKIDSKRSLLKQVLWWEGP